MFEPGHLHRASVVGQIDFSVDLFYEVRRNPNEGPMLHFRMEGQVAGKAFKDEFDRMFNDIREKLGAKSGEAVNFDHLEKDGL